MGKRYFFSPKHPDWLWGPPSFLLNGYCGSFPGVQQLEHDVDYSPPSSTKVKNKWSYTSTPPICLDGKDRDNFYFSNVQCSVKWSIMESQVFGWFLGLQKSISIVINNKSASVHIYTSVRNPWCTITMTTFTYQKGAVPHAVVQSTAQS
jgi:hypothetical protein